jgi:hypothetical protein
VMGSHGKVNRVLIFRISITYLVSESVVDIVLKNEFFVSN